MGICTLPGELDRLSLCLPSPLSAGEIGSGGAGAMYAEEGTLPRIFMGVDPPCRASIYGDGEFLVTVVSASTRGGVGARLFTPRFGTPLEVAIPGGLPKSAGSAVLPSGINFRSRLAPLFESILPSTPACGVGDCNEVTA